MSEPILIVGESGAGKSYSCRNMDPSTTLLVSVEGKRYPFSMNGWEKMDSKTPSGSLYCPQKKTAYAVVKKAVAAAIECGKKIIVIDDSQFLMSNEFFHRAYEKGYDKFTAMGCNFHDLIEWARTLPDDVTVYFLHHNEFENERMKVKTVGKMLDSQTNIPGKFTICLLASKIEDEYKFSASVDGQALIKAPPGMFEIDPMDNDLAAVDKSIREFWGI